MGAHGSSVGSIQWPGGAKAARGVSAFAHGGKRGWEYGCILKAFRRPACEVLQLRRNHHE
jgi:hypothetical protein